MKPRSKSVWMVPAARGRGVPGVDGPGPGLLRAGGEEGLEPEDPEPDVDQLHQSRLLLAVAREQLGRVRRVEGGDLGLDLGREHHRLGRSHQRAEPGVEIGVAERPLVDVERVDDRFGAEQVEVGEQPGVDLAGCGGRGNGAPAVQDLAGLLGGAQCRRQIRLLAHVLGQSRQPVVDGLQVGEDELGVDGLDVVRRVDAAVDVDHVGVLEDADHLADRVALPDGRQELVPEPLPLRGALHDPGDVDEGDRGRHDLLRREQLGQPVEAGVGHGHHTHVGIDGGEGVVGGEDLVAGQGVEQGGLPHVGEADDADGQSHGWFLRSGRRPGPTVRRPRA